MTKSDRESVELVRQRWGSAARVVEAAGFFLIPVAYFAFVGWCMIQTCSMP